MRFRVRYRHPAPPDRPSRLYLMLPADRPGQRIHDARLSRPPRERRTKPGRALACFELEPASELTLDFELDAVATPAPPSEDAHRPLQELIEEVYARLLEEGYRLDGGEDAEPGAAALTLALGVLQAARERGWGGEVVLGHLLLSEPAPHAWCRLQTPAGAVECDPWFHLVLQGVPDYWLAYGLAPRAEDYLSGHEGRRVVWGTAPVPASALPCLADAAEGSEDGGFFYFWPDAVWIGGAGFLPPANRELAAVETGTAAAFRGALEAFRVAAFAGLLLVALGLVQPGGWTLLAYASYAALLARVQGPAWWRLLQRPSARETAFEPLLFHAAFLAVVAGWSTVLPQTLFALTWIYRRARTLWQGYRDAGRRPDRA
ncbi:hypothetical protein Ocepr_1028 [Oceanithermus profundus DSM 14977]|uniref:Uncharacterized protein n=1 Tax=Oceanithermus profundus (strain DSM 14977 / NBRC 100410 / VKM B-2274 / 506) TaxID=670487 RepID=E4U7N6_OCEP5|nr:hypothetical protein [Oceanithermus profundus]ADR36485.1 hypothetical protein Ocepr_1028 [Oceanithermus profundus DSM 14977]